MPIIRNFNGRQIIEPGAYSRIIGTPNVVASPSASGNVVIIDTGSNATFGGGAGIAGTNTNGKNAIYTFQDPSAFKNFIKGGLFWDLADYLFGPSNNGQGVPQLTYIKAAATVPGTLTYTFTGGGSNGGVFTITTKDEGLVANGVQVTSPSTFLVKGYGAKMFLGVADPTKFYIEFYLGTFRGLDSYSEPYDGIQDNETAPILITRSIEFSNIADLISWAKIDQSFNAAFTLTTQTVTGTGVVDSTDLSTNAALKLVTGGTETYSSTQLDTILANISDMGDSFILADKWGSNSDHAYNQKLLTYALNQAQFGVQIIIGGADGSADYAAKSVAAAKVYNSQRATVVHSGIIIKSLVVASADRNRGSIYTAAMVVGRESGVEPQVPITWKDLRITRMQHPLTEQQRKECLLAGVLHIKQIPQIGLAINQGINTLQKNLQLVNPDGSSYEKSLVRIADQLNKEIVLNSAPLYVGGNLNTSSPVILKTFTENYLLGKIATPLEDNLIISFKNVKVKLVADYYDITYEFISNGPINKLFFTGVQLPVTLSA